MIRENNKAEFVKEMENFLRQTNACEHICLTYGNLQYVSLEQWQPGAVIKDCWDEESKSMVAKYFLEEFTPSDVTLKGSACRENVQIKMGNKTVYACVEADSYYGIIIDVIKKMMEENM